MKVKKKDSIELLSKNIKIDAIKVKVLRNEGYNGLPYVYRLISREDVPLCQV